MFYLIGSIIAFSVLILIHEGGHFIVAKSVGMKVNEFALGMGPKIYSFQKGETLYSLRAFPIGGFVKPEGEDDKSDHPRAFGNKPLWARAAVVSAGPISNFLLAFLIIIVLLTFAGVPYIYVGDIPAGTQSYGLQKGDMITKVDNKSIFIADEINGIVKENNSQTVDLTILRDKQETILRVPTVYSNLINQNVLGVHTITIWDVSKGMPSERAGILKGDVLTKIDGTDIFIYDELVKAVDNAKGKNILVSVVRNGVAQDLSVQTSFSEELGRYIIGIIPDQMYGLNVENRGIVKNFTESFGYSTSLTKQIGYGLKKLFTGKVSKNEIAGPVGIIQLSGKVLEAGIYEFINFVALLSLSLGIFNLFPIPALDGGRLVFMAIEGIRGKPVEQQKEAMVHFVGFMALILLMIVVTFNDIKRVFGL